MPQKTKKAKLKASQQRSKSSVSKRSNETSQVQGDSDLEPKKFTYSFKTPKQDPSMSTIKTRLYEDDSFPAIKRDLFKTVTLAALSFAVLIGLSFILK